MARRLAIVGIAVFLCAAALSCIDWGEAARVYILRTLARSTGRAVSLDKVTIRPGAPLRFTLTGLVLDNPSWARHRHLLQLQSGRFSLRLFPLLFKGQLSFGEVALTRLVVNLEQRKGRRSWEFDDDAALSGAAEILRVDALRVVDAVLRYSVVEDRTDLVVAAARRPGSAGEINVEAAGVYKAERLRAHAVSGSPLHLGDASRPVPLKLDAAVGPTRVRFDGRVGRLESLQQVDGNLTLEGASLVDLRRFLQVRLPETAPYRVEGHLTRDAGDWRLENFVGSLGGRRFAGSATYDPAAQPPALETQLQAPVQEAGTMVSTDSAEITESIGASSVDGGLGDDELPGLGG